MQEVKKVVIIGPESTGKSSLCERLSTHFNSPWCPEYAREYLLTNGKEYTFDHLLDIAKGQVALEEKYLDKAREVAGDELAKPFLFVDKDMYLMKVWCEYVFGKCHQYIFDTIVERSADLYLLCETDLPWVKDELREYPDHESREELFRIYKDIMVNQQVPWATISGTDENRYQSAIDVINHHFFPLGCV
jgi:NadR type nicotinamide-nucleotide adenylyltransferase